MDVGGAAQRAIRLAGDGERVEIIDQTRLPFEFVVVSLEDLDGAVEAIERMRVRGAPLIGVTAAYGVCLQLRADPSDAALDLACERLLETRPTAVNLQWALDEMRRAVADLDPRDRASAGYARAGALADEDVALCRAIGEHGVGLLEEVAERTPSRPVQVLTHCNAGWLATVDWGTALAPIYVAQERGLDVHVWVDETRPRNQGASLTAWELGQQGVPHTVIADNAGGHLMQRGEVDLCITGCDRAAANGDVCNKIGTYLKALAAWDNGIPFYAALPYSTIDWSLPDGDAIPIEERAGDEVRRIRGRTSEGSLADVEILPDTSAVANFAFDVTPARLVTGVVTERGIAEATPEGFLRLYPERREGP